MLSFRKRRLLNVKSQSLFNRQASALFFSKRPCRHQYIPRPPAKLLSRVQSQEQERKQLNLEDSIKKLRQCRSCSRFVNDVLQQIFSNQKQQLSYRELLQNFKEDKSNRIQKGVMQMLQTTINFRRELAKTIISGDKNSGVQNMQTMIDEKIRRVEQTSSRLKDLRVQIKLQEEEIGRAKERSEDEKLVFKQRLQEKEEKLDLVKNQMGALLSTFKLMINNQG